jgi:hypothetical protein
MRNRQRAWLGGLIMGFLATTSCTAAHREQATEASLAAIAAAEKSARVLSEVQSRAFALERHLAARDDEVAALQTEVRRLREREEASRAALATLKVMLQARAARATVPYTPRLNLQTLTRTAEEAAGTDAGREASPAASEAPPAKNEQRAAADASDAIRLKAAEAQLSEERNKRSELEAELERLRRETSVGPYADSAADELRAARRKIEGLEAALASAHRARDELAAKYEALRTRLQAVSEQSSAALQAQVKVLEQQQREALASVEQELAASRSRETELREALAAAERGREGASWALVADLRAENAALRARLEEEHQRNVVLAGKLKLASRIAEMIFKARVGQAKISTQ